MKQKIKNNILLNLLLLSASAVLLTFAHPPFKFSFLAWFALVPFILVFFDAEKPGRLFLTAYIISSIYWLGNLYWIGLVTIPGYIAFCLYTALLWPLAGIAIRFCSRKKIPLVISVPLVIVGAEQFQGFLLGGFLWRLLAHSQYANLTIIQIADIFGAAGVSFLVAIVNAALAEIIIAIINKNLLTLELGFKIICAAVLVIAACLYGRWRIEQTDEYLEAGPVVGVLQSNIPQSVKDTESLEVSKETFASLLQTGDEIIDAGAELVVWPETIIPAVLDQRILGIVDPNSYLIDFDRQLREHALNRCWLLVGATGGTAQIHDDYTITLASRYNSAFLYNPGGYQSSKQYNKIHIVPFGEYVPFRKSFPPLYRVLMNFTPYDFDYSLEPGTEYTVFDIKTSEGKEYSFSVMICYEGTIPEIARKFTLDKNGKKRIHWLLNISNDGWFVRFEDQKVKPSTELSQHAAVCVFRAVENRLAVIRSVNTGISCLIDSKGRIKDNFLEGNLPINPMKRTGIAGWFTDKMPIDTRVTFFTKYGQWLDLACSTALVVVLLGMAAERIYKRKKRKPGA